jgi:hypothetical protein
VIRRAALAATAAGCACALPAAAQTAPDAPGIASSAAPAGRSDVVINGASFDFNLAEDQSVATAQIGGYSVRNSDGEDRNSQLSQNWLVTLSAPIGGKKGFDPSALLDTLSDGTQLSFSYSWFGFSGAGKPLLDPHSRFGTIHAAAIARCVTMSQNAAGIIGEAIAGADARRDPYVLGEIAKQAVKDARVTVEDDVVEAAVNAAIAALVAKKSRAEIIDAAEKTSAAEAVIEGDERGACEAPRDPDFALKYSDASRSDIARALFAPMWRVGLKGSVGVKRFEFIELGTLAARDPSRPQFGASVFGALYLPGGTSAFLVNAEYQNGFEAPKEALVCKPVVVNPDKDCVTGVPGGPHNVERWNLSVEFRNVFELPKLPFDVAISPKATYDAHSDEFAAQFPIYFLPRKASNFSPGVSATYSSKTGKVGYAIFMRTSFTL